MKGRPLLIDIHLRTKSGRLIPKLTSIRILGMMLEATGTDNIRIQRLAKKRDSVIRSIRQVANRRAEPLEDNLVRLVHAFLLLYAFGRKWKETSLMQELGGWQRMTLGSPTHPHIHTNSHFLLLVIHNTLKEITKAQEKNTGNEAFWLKKP